MSQLKNLRHSQQNERKENLGKPACDVRVGSVDSILNEVRHGIRLNRVQSAVKDCIFNSNENAVVGAPTGNNPIMINILD
jgi:replicative superfamily II helicase